ncbi:hypothetical protein [Kitasatospora sp. NPDC088783]|uniref:hypothetical protein n=1 Tax=Kitasatospora sp. NPDC088783 TaxID=3364077 RepID=UPI0038089E4E
MNDTRATAHALTAAYRHLPAGHLMTRAEAARRIAPLLGLAPAGAAGRRITDAIAAGALVELRPAGDTRLTVPGAPAGAVVSVVPGTVEESVEVVIENPEGTVELYLGGRGRRTGPALNLTRRSLVLCAANAERLAAELHRLWAEIQTYAATTPEAIGAALAAAGLPGAEDAGCGWWTTHSGNDGRPMVVHADGTRTGPRRTDEAEQRHWAEQLDAVEDALRLARFQVRRSAGHAVIVHGRTTPGQAQPADIVRVASRTVRRPGGSTAKRSYLHVNCACRLTASLQGTYSSSAEALAALRARAAGAGGAYTAPVACRGNRRRPEDPEDAEVPEDADALAPCEVGQDGGLAAAPAPVPAGQGGGAAAREEQRLAAAEAVRELLAAAGEVDLDAAGPGPTGRAGFQVRASARDGVWVRILRKAPVRSEAEHERDLARWARVLRRARWGVARTGARGSEAYGLRATASPRVLAGLAARRRERARTAPPQPQPGHHHAPPAHGVPAGAVEQQSAAAVPAPARGAGGPLGIAEIAGAFDPREMAGNVFTDEAPLDVAVPAAAKWLRAAQAARAAGRGRAAEAAEGKAAAALHTAARTADAATWTRIARWLAGPGAGTDAGADGPAADDLAEAVPGLPALAGSAARFLALGLTSRSLVMIKAADQGTRRLAQALRAAVGADGEGLWPQVARYAVEREAAALIAAGSVGPVVELGAPGPPGGPARPLRPAVAATPGESTAAARARLLEERLRPDGIGPLPDFVRVLDYDVNSYEWGVECSRHDGGWVRQPGSFEYRAEAECAARSHARQHRSAVGALTDDHIAQARALGFSLAQHQVLGEAVRGRVWENATGLFHPDDLQSPSGRVQRRRVADLWVRGLVRLVDDGPHSRQILATEAGAAAHRLLAGARRQGTVAYCERDTMRSTGPQRAAWPRIKAAPVAAVTAAEPDATQRRSGG